ncbi:hypothetical protein [Paractinoplanes lichenicola]|uniref:Uncharacterized protein n=1 Tax=Paractinoplanes lichenicola TaxID=2802976 RepID=A0ABS1VUW0_9ACTN|nr:hypothetical protein [Actinoplanes lichenicola]MBL7258222.1 hypothetical protein [Actinoplanes lichenicola]
MPDSYWHEEESLASYLVWALSTAELLGLSPSASYVSSRCEELDLEALPEEHLVELANALSASRMIPTESSRRFRRSVHTRVTEEIRDCIYSENLLRATELYQVLVTLENSDPEDKYIGLIYAAVSDRLDYLTGLADDELDEELVGEVAGLVEFLGQAEGHPVDTSTANALLARHWASATETTEPGAFSATQRHVPVDVQRGSVARLMRQLDPE